MFKITKLIIIVCLGFLPIKAWATITASPIADVNIGNVTSFTLPFTPSTGDYLILSSAKTITFSFLTSITETNVTWTKVSTYTGGRHSEVWIGSVGTNPGTGITFAFDGSGTNALGSGQVSEWRGLSGSVDTALSGNTGTSATPATSRITPTAGANVLIIGSVNRVVAYSSASTTSGFTELTSNGSQSNRQAYLVTPSASGSYGDEWTYTSSQNWDTTITAFGADVTAPTLSSVTPASSAFIDNVTSSSDVAFTSSETLSSGTITITQTGGTADAASPHVCTLQGNALKSGPHTIDLSNATDSCTTDVSNLVAGSVYTFAFAGSDLGGNAAATVTRTNVTFDNVAPTITNISSNKADGSYKTGEVIDINVAFSEAATSTGSVTVTLETGAIDRTCTFAITNSTTGTCNYTVQNGDTSSDLTVALVSGTITDATGNSMTNFVPATNLAANKNIVIDTTPPAAPGAPSSLSESSDTTPDFSISCESGASVALMEGVVTLGTGVCVGGTVIITSPTLTESAHSIFAVQTDLAGNVSASSPTVSITIVSPVSSVPLIIHGQHRHSVAHVDHATGYVIYNSTYEGLDPTKMAVIQSLSTHILQLILQLLQTYLSQGVR